MAQILSAFSRDANGTPIWTDGLIASKAITYVAGTTGATGVTTLFTVTGVVTVRVFGVCGTTITGAGTLEVGISGATAVILAQIVNATDLAANELYLDATPTTQVEALPSQLIISNGQDIIQTIGTTALTGGQITYYCIWTPLSSDGNVVAA
ncbi:hypothetical protein HY967_01545 [Candidatus Jorgensenbacteria bacterium]|nr:hypothetical protein [Candidatus Jorgensenbacteria bacterium]